MFRRAIAPLAALLALSGSIAAQTPSRAFPAMNPTEQVRSWYRQLFNRELDRAAQRWIDELRRGTAADQVLARIMGSEEYYQQAGSNPEGFIRRFFDDLRGRDPTREELRNWSRQLQTRKREDVVLALIREGPAPQPPPDTGDADYFAELRDAIRRVDEKLEDLSEDIVEELSGQAERDLVRKTEAAIDDLHAFQRVARPGIPRDRMERAFNQFDSNLDQVLDEVRRAAGKQNALRRSADRVSSADHRLDLAFYANTPTPDKPNKALLREAEALVSQTKRLRQSVSTLIPNVVAGNRIRRNLDTYLERAERFRDSIKDGASIQQLRRTFPTLVEPWSAAVRDLNTLPAAGSYYTLRQQAQRVEQIAAWLQSQLRAEVDIPFIRTAPAPKP